MTVFLTRRLRVAGLGAALALGAGSCAPQDDVPVKKLARPEPAADVKAAPDMPVALQPRIDAALEDVHARDLRTSNGFWTIFHGILGMGPATTLLEPESGRRVNALEEVRLRGSKIRGLEFVKTEQGLDVVTQVGSGVYQGHQDQFIAEMAQWGLPRDARFVVDGKDYTFDDFIRQSKMRASLTRNQELSWAVIIVAQYYGTAHAWTNAYGEKLTLEDLVRYELGQPIDTAACGGTHRLFGLTWAYHLHTAGGGKSDGLWRDVALKLDEYKALALKYQNDDGAFSANYVSKPGKTLDLQMRIATTGHVLEWLALAMTDEELHLPKVQHAASALSEMILSNRSNPLDTGPLYHATHGLHIYRTRVFKTPPPAGLLIP